MTDEELIAELHDTSESTLPAYLANEAASRIERLSRDRAALLDAAKKVLEANIDAYGERLLSAAIAAAEAES